MDWLTWHQDYDRPSSALARRLDTVQSHIRNALDASPPGPVSVLSLCAGQGSDLLGVLETHPRRDDVTATLVELDPRNSAEAERAARTAGLEQITVITGDASLTDYYRELAPADLVLLCGIFGNISDEDVHRTIGFATSLCRTDATVIWTRHRREPDLVPTICRWFETLGFERIAVSPPGAGFGAGAHRFRGQPQLLPTGEQMFTFVGSDVLRQQGRNRLQK